MLGKDKKKGSEKVKPSEAGLPESAVEAKVRDAKGEVKSMAQVPVNELVFRKGMKLELEGLPFEVSEVKGIELVLKRKDIK